MTEAFSSWAILEIMGHRVRAGYVREVEIAGSKLLRIDVLVGKDDADQDVMLGRDRARQPQTLRRGPQAGAAAGVSRAGSPATDRNRAFGRRGGDTVLMPGLLLTLEDHTGVPLESPVMVESEGIARAFARTYGWQIPEGYVWTVRTLGDARELKF